MYIVPCTIIRRCDRMGSKRTLIRTTPDTVYTHPEMFDENGNLRADEILAVRFENYDNNNEEEDND